MDYFLPRVALIGSLLSTIVACTAGNYDLPACGDLEICGNGKDDDCDGIKDNPEICACQPVGKLADCPPRVGIFTKPTYPASRCTEQKQLCRDDLQLDICRGIDPIFEQCANKIDDDCDGEVDEADCVPCIDNQEQNIYDSKFSYGPNSKCKPEIQVCKDGRWVTKTAAIGPRANDTTCDGQDDDCDNILDEDATWTSLPLSKTFKKGELCYDINKAGICRTVGTVVCNAGASSCDSFQQTPVMMNDHRNYVSPTAFFDPANPLAVWDWNCDGKIDSIFCTGLGKPSTCTSSNVTKNKLTAVDSTTNCTFIGFPFCDNWVVIQSVIPGASIQCGAQVQVYACQADVPFPAAPCKNATNPLNGYMYCN